MRTIEILDTTLRDGSQGEGISFSVRDKVEVARRLDELGIAFVEGGWPGSNPKDAEFFAAMAGAHLRQALLTAFTSTRRAGCLAKDDGNIQAVLAAGTPAVSVVGKSWDLHVHEALRVSLAENLAMVGETIAYLKSQGRQVLFDAEHFFDGFKRNRDYALRVLEVAAGAGADRLVLCDTNGGSLPDEVGATIDVVRSHVATPVGIHAHNDCELAVANTLAAVAHGAGHVQGTINGYGERCGNANLCSIIPNLEIKLGLSCLPPGQLAHLTETSRFVAELANMVPLGNQPFVGKSAFAHKAGIHVSAVRRAPLTYEHVEPTLVGNNRRILLSELSGRSNVISRADGFAVSAGETQEQVSELVELLKQLEYEGYQFEGAEASFELLAKRLQPDYSQHRYFQLEGFRVTVAKNGKYPLTSDATIKLRVGDHQEHTAAEGNGPVNALDNALRKALETFYPELREMKLIDYKVRVIDGRDGTGAKVRVLITSGDQARTWGTVGVHENIIEASWQALTDAIEYKLELARMAEPVA